MISLSGEQTDPAGLEYLVSQGAEGVAGAHLENILMKIFERNIYYQGQDVGQARMGDQNEEGAGRLVVQPLHLQRYFQPWLSLP